MSNYIPHTYPFKRLAKLEDREGIFAQVLRSGIGGARLRKEAEKLRAAKLSLLKGMRYHALKDPTKNQINFDLIATINADSEEWESKSVESIIEIYNKKLEEKETQVSDTDSVLEAAST